MMRKHVAARRQTLSTSAEPVVPRADSFLDPAYPLSSSQDQQSYAYFYSEEHNAEDRRANCIERLCG
jgi:hypothetical protein